jgi:Amt family ammonium transporter
MATSNHLKTAVLAALATAAGSLPAFAQDAPVLDSGNTAWMLTSTALVLMMTIPGLALFYGGMVRQKNALGTLMHSFIIMFRTLLPRTMPP